MAELPAELPQTLVGLSPEELAAKAARQSDTRYLLQEEVILTGFSKDPNDKLRDAEAQLVAAELRENTSTKQLWLSDNQIGIPGAIALASALEYNNTLVLLSLRGNLNIGNEGVEAVAASLQHNRCLRSLFLSRMRLTREAAYSLSVLLKKNTTLQELSLTDNQIRDDGAVALARSLESNFSLRQLYLERNAIGVIGGQALAEMLEANNSLQELMLSGNKIASAGIGRFMHALRRNWGLLRLDLDQNEHDMLEIPDMNKSLALALRDNSSLEHLTVGFDYTQGSAGPASQTRRLVEEALLDNRTILTISPFNGPPNCKEVFRRNNASMKDQRGKLYRALLVLGNNRSLPTSERCRLAALPTDLIRHIATFADPYHAKPASHLKIRALDVATIFNSGDALKERLRRKAHAEKEKEKEKKIEQEKAQKDQSRDDSFLRGRRDLTAADYEPAERLHRSPAINSAVRLLQAEVGRPRPPPPPPVPVPAKPSPGPGLDMGFLDAPEDPPQRTEDDVMVDLIPCERCNASVPFDHYADHVAFCGMD